MNKSRVAFICVAMLMSPALHGQIQEEVNALCDSMQSAQAQVTSMIHNSTEALVGCRSDQEVCKALMTSESWSRMAQPICMARQTQETLVLGDALCGTNVEGLVEQATIVMEEMAVLTARRIDDACIARGI